MKRILVLLSVVAVAVSAHAITPTFDGVLTEWTGPTVNSLGSYAAPGGGVFEVLISYDDNNLYIGVNRDSSDRYLGDTAWDNDSFFFAIDTDGTASSGAGADGYARANFGGTYLPDQFYYYAGGPNWYESSTWNGSSHTWNGWSDSGALYGYQEANPDDELAIPLSDIGGSADVMVWAWMTREANGYVETSWPDGYTGTSPTFGDGVMAIPEPVSATLFAIGGLFALALRRRRAVNG